MVHRKPAGSDAADRMYEDDRTRRAAADVDRESGKAQADFEGDAGRERVSVAAWNPGDIALSPRAPLHSEARWDRVPRGLRSGRIANRSVRRELELARAHMVPIEFPADRVAAEIPSLLWRR